MREPPQHGTAHPPAQGEARRQIQQSSSKRAPKLPRSNGAGLDGLRWVHNAAAVAGTLISRAPRGARSPPAACPLSGR